MKLNKRNIAKTLRDCAFDPNDYQMKIVADVGNLHYFILRATEELRRIEPDLTMAIRLLVLAKMDKL